jgi:putative flippase GtrA
MIAHTLQLARFCAVSLFCFGLGLVVLTGLHELAGVHYLLAYVASFVVTSTLGYLLNGRYTFRAQQADGPGLLRYMLVNVGLLLVNGMALRLLVEYVHVWYLYATLLLAVINTPVSFLAHRIVSYRLPPRLSDHPGTIVYGCFKGMGDLLSAAPTIVAALSHANQVVLIVFPPLREVIDLIEFGPHRHKLEVCALPVTRRGPKVREFLRDLSQYSPDLIWISPHAQLGNPSAWKGSFIMWALRLYYGRDAVLTGADSERLSWLFDLRMQVDRRAPYMSREWAAYSALQITAPAALPGPIALIEPIARLRSASPSYDLLIHPGAGSENRKWPWPFYAQLVARIPDDQRIAVAGLPDDVAAMRAVLPADRQIHYLTGSLTETVKSLAASRVALTMDSGTMHFANSLGIPAIALFGPCDPATVLPESSSVTPLYQPKWPCQPCGNLTCNQKSVYCMGSIDPGSVADALLRLL